MKKEKGRQEINYATKSRRKCKEKKKVPKSTWKASFGKEEKMGDGSQNPEKGEERKEERMYNNILRRWRGILSQLFPLCERF